MLEWMTAIGTIGAALVPGVLWFVERRDRKAAEAELRSRDAADQAAAVERQARQIFVWKVWGDAGDNRDGVSMLNTSALPVFEVCLYGYGGRTNRQMLDEDGYETAVLPGKGFAAAAGGGIDDNVWIAFRDASVRHWARDEIGTLVKDPDREGMAESRLGA